MSYYLTCTTSGLPVAPYLEAFYESALGRVETAAGMTAELGSKRLGLQSICAILYQATIQEETGHEMASNAQRFMEQGPRLVSDFEAVNPSIMRSWLWRSDCMHELRELWATFIQKYGLTRLAPRVESKMSELERAEKLMFLDIHDARVDTITYAFLFSLADICKNDEVYVFSINELVPDNKECAYRWKTGYKEHLRQGDRRLKNVSYRQALDHFYKWSERHGYKYKLDDKLFVKIWW